MTPGLWRPGRCRVGAGSCGSIQPGGSLFSQIMNTRARHSTPHVTKDVHICSVGFGGPAVPGASCGPDPWQTAVKDRWKKTEVLFPLALETSVPPLCTPGLYGREVGRVPNGLNMSSLDRKWTLIYRENHGTSRNRRKQQWAEAQRLEEPA